MSLGSARSLAELLLMRAESTPHGRAFSFPETGGTAELSWLQVQERAFALAGGLLSLGLERGDRCAILSSTRIEWIVADLAILCAGGVTATIYPANTPEECEKILLDSQAKWVFAESPEQLEKLRRRRARLLDVRRVVLFDGSPPREDTWGLTLDELTDHGREFNRNHPGEVERIARAIGPDELATLIYTSGTTGEPKGVELTHDCWLAAAETIDQLEIVSSRDLQLLWLPLSHSFGKVLLALSVAVGFETFVDGRVPHLMENLPRVRPTFMAAAPRIFEKIYSRIVATAEQAGGLRRAIFRWAAHTGRQVSKARQMGHEPGSLRALQYRIAERLVFAPLRARFGGRLRFFVSGSAPLSTELAEFFHGAGLLIIEGYGLTESTAIGGSGSLREYRFGSIRPHAGIELRLAPDGEILMKGRAIMRGYHRQPEATREVLDEEGFLHTGDIGELDRDGWLRITDRKKDLIKTSGGKYIAPQKLESRLKALCPYISQVVVHGNNRNFCTALVTLDEDSISGWCKDRGLGDLPAGERAEREEVIELVQRSVDQLNEDLASYETLKRFAVLPEDFSVESGELTPSLKVKRRVVEERFRSVLDGFYREPPPSR